MTWKEFKEIMEKQGIRDEDEIEWIDTHMPTMSFPPEIKREIEIIEGKSVETVQIHDVV